MKIEIVGVWKGNNISEIIRELMRINQELHVRVSGKKLIIKEININFYLCVRPGERIEIPDNLVAYDQIEEEPLPVPQEILIAEQERDFLKQVQTTMALQNKKSWGLI